MSVGIGLDDFRRMTIEEISATLTAVGQARTDEARRHWEVMRMETYMTLAPFCKNLPQPKKLLPFPWDDEDQAPQEPAKPISQSEREANYQAARAKLGW